jgi:hypothetical protein
VPTARSGRLPRSATSTRSYRRVVGGLGASAIGAEFKNVVGQRGRIVGIDHRASGGSRTCITTDYDGERQSFVYSSDATILLLRRERPQLDSAIVVLERDHTTGAASKIETRLSEIADLCIVHRDQLLGDGASLVWADFSAAHLAMDLQDQMNADDVF